MKRKMNCKKYQKLFSKFIDEELSTSEDISVRKHLDQCERCRADVDAMRSIKRTLLSLPEIHSSPNFEVSLQDKLSNLEGRRQRFNHVTKYVAIYASIACLILALSFGAYILNKGADDQETYMPYEETYLSFTLDADGKTVKSFVMPIVRSGAVDTEGDKLGLLISTYRKEAENHYVLEHILNTNFERCGVWR